MAMGREDMMERKDISKCLVAVSIAALGTILPGAAWADTVIEETHFACPVSIGPGVTEYQYTRTVTETPLTEQFVTVEKPVVIEKSEKTHEKMVITQTIRQRPLITAKRRVLASKPIMRHRTAHILASGNRTFYKERTIERTIEKPVLVEKPVFIDRPVDRVVEKPVYIDRVVEKPVMIEQQAEKPVMIEKPVVIERQVEQPVLIERRHHHLLNMSIF